MMPSTSPRKEHLVELGIDAGLVAVGFTTAEPFAESIDALQDRKSRGLSADMAFTYRNPARSGDIRATFSWARSIIVGAWPYPAHSASGGDANSPGAIAAYVWQPHYDALRDALGTIAAELHGQGFRARVVADDNALIDRAAAVRAGIGWWGKNTNVLIPGYGSWFVLGSVVTDAEFAPDTGVDASCGSCRRCLDGCPTGAIVEPGVLDARRCLAWLVQSAEEFPVEFRAALGGRIYGCDDCQLVCPPNRRGQLVATEARTTADLDVVLNGSDHEILDRYGDWYIPKRDVRYVRRNALIAWANTVELDDPTIDARLKGLLGGSDLMLVAYAIWATRRVDRASLLDGIDWDRLGEHDEYWRRRLRRERDQPVTPRHGREVPEPVRIGDRPER